MECMNKKNNYMYFYFENILVSLPMKFSSKILFTLNQESHEYFLNLVTLIRMTVNYNLLFIPQSPEFPI